MFYVSFIGPCHSVSGTVYTRGKYGGSFSNMSAPVTTCTVAISLNVQMNLIDKKHQLSFIIFSTYAGTP